MLQKTILVFVSIGLLFWITTDVSKIVTYSKSCKRHLEFLHLQNSQEEMMSLFGMIVQNLTLRNREEWNKYYALNPNSYDFNETAKLEMFLGQHGYHSFLEHLDKLPEVKTEKYKGQLTLIKNKIIYEHLLNEVAFRTYIMSGCGLGGPFIFKDVFNNIYLSHTDAYLDFFATTVNHVRSELSNGLEFKIPYSDTIRLDYYRNTAYDNIYSKKSDKIPVPASHTYVIAHIIE